MPESLVRTFTRFRFIVEIEADCFEPFLVPAGPEPAKAACARILSDEINSNLSGLDGIASVRVEEVDPPSR